MQLNRFAELLLCDILLFLTSWFAGNYVEKQQKFQPSILSRSKWFLIGGILIAVIVIVLVLAIVYSSLSNNKTTFKFNDPTVFPPTGMIFLFSKFKIYIKQFTFQEIT